MGYASEYDDLCLGDINNGKLRTRDIGYKDKDGFFLLQEEKADL